MQEHIVNIVERALNCGNIEKGYFKHKSIECNEKYIHGFTCKSKFCSKQLLKDLQDAVYAVVSNYYKNKVKGNHEVGLMALVHTFGSDLKWNPHIHALFTEGGIAKNNKQFKKVSHILYKYIRKSWRKLVLNIK